MNDPALVSAMTRLGKDRRDASAWEDLYRIVYPYLLAICFRRVRGNRYVAEEAVQEIMLRLLKSFDFRSRDATPASLISYLNQISRSVAADLFKREKKSEITDSPKPDGEREGFFGPDLSVGPAGEALFQVRLERAIKSLNKRDSAIVRMLIEGRTREEIAETLNIADKTAYNAVSIARKRLRKLLFN